MRGLLWLALALLALSAPVWAGSGSASVSVNIQPVGVPPNANFIANFSDIHQTIDGFGASSAWVGNLNPPTLDALYCINATDPGCSGPGIGLTLLREGIDTADNGVTFQDTIPSCSPVTNTCQPSKTSAAGAKARGATLFATPWTVNPSNYQTSAQGLANWAAEQAAAGVPIYAMTTENEADCCGGFLYPAGNTAAYAAVLGPILHALSPPVKLISPEVEDPANFNSYISAIEGNSTANAQVDIFSTHQYGCGITCMTVDGTRHVWENEASDFSGAANYDIYNAMSQSQHWIYDAIVTVGINGWNYWNSVCNCNAGVIGDVTLGLGQVPKRYYGIGNWSKFVRPGWVRIGTSGPGASNIFVGAFKSPDSKKFAIVTLNYNGSDTPNITFGLQNATVSGNVTPYVTSGTPIGVIGTDGNLSAGSASSGVPSSLVPNAGVWTSTVPVGITTFVGTAQ
jgi:glucuronoarabinoxylan endo-1,4-beta-xylanase